MEWYIVNVYSGSEEKVCKAIHDQAQRSGLSSSFGEILIPTEEVVELKKGEKVKTSKKFFPGYILVQMDLTDKAWHLVKSTPKVSGFLGTKEKPQPISESEMKRIVKKVEDSTQNPRHSVDYEIGDAVTVCDGPFASFRGTIDGVDQEKERVKVAVSIFGRSTNVDLSFFQIEKIV
ncbi:MAG: transcription termination/antitermination protein NusG [Holosporaceae bacterium]|jgi:transcriptional antiterminator NusG|nr:transcription termination/antitermination protein NusG [Holosporaceae bacterium]